MATFFPYLRAKKHELTAVRRAATAIVSKGKILPIFEPVKVKTNTFLQGAVAFQTAGLTVSLVMNPQVGGLTGNPFATIGLLASIRQAGAAVVPALIVHDQLQVAEVTTFGQQLQGSCLLVHEGVPTAAGVMTALGGLPSTTHVFVEGLTSSGHQAGFAQRCLLRDGFAAQPRNADYPAQSFFSDLHLTYSGNGLAGFGDYTTNGNRYTVTGGPAYAVAIHMTEEDLGSPKPGIYCNHFLSVSNLTTANPAGKFAEALDSLVTYSQANPGRIDFSSAYRELHQHHINGTYPGLGVAKRLSIQHHLELMSRIV